MYKLNSTKHFEKAVTKLLKSKRLSQEVFKKTILTLIKTPFSLKLKTHKVVSRNHGQRYSSRIDGDLRIIWDFDENENLVLLLLDIGGHDGKRAVYK